MNSTYTLVLLRHGQSTWNLENRFTGWTDVGLTAQGEDEAHQSAKLLLEGSYTFDLAYTSVLKRAIKTLWIVMEDMDIEWLPVINAWQLNERHYGALQGLNKAEMAVKFGEAQVKLWRRSYDVPPPALDLDDERYPGFVACEFSDAHGHKHTVIDKVPILTDENLDSSSPYPLPGIARCEVLSRWRDDRGRDLVRITLDRPITVESTEGLTEFVVLAQQLSTAQ